MAFPMGFPAGLNPSSPAADSRLETKDFVHIVQEVQSASDMSEKHQGHKRHTSREMGEKKLLQKHTDPGLYQEFSGLSAIFAFNQLIFPA